MESNQTTSLSTSIKQWLRRRFALLIVSLLITALVVVFFYDRIIITIDSGEAAILFRRFSGTEIDKIYGEGLHLFSPLDIVYIYEVRNQVAYHDFDVITNKGLKVHLSLAIRYRPEYDLLGILHQRIGPDYLTRVILPQIESVMRKELGNYTAEEIYTNKAGLLTNAILNALEEVGRNYVEVEDIIIRSITLPDKIVMAIENKLEQEEIMKSYEFRLQTAMQEAERLKIEGGGIKTYHQTIAESLNESILRYKGVEATERLATSNNAKVVVIGSGKDGLPVILNTEPAVSAPQTSQQPDNSGNDANSSAAQTPSMSSGTTTAGNAPAARNSP